MAASSASALAGPELHEEWSARYRTEENEAVFEDAFDRILAAFSPPAGATILDAGCGTASHTIRLARRGFRLESVDFSDHALELARANAAEAGLADQVHFRQADLMALPFADGQFQYAFCWGVLLHVPEVERAVVELARVVGPGGKLAVSEPNMRSLQTLALRAGRRLRGRSGQDIRETPAGIEKWRKAAEGDLVTRQTDIKWLIERFATEGLTLHSRSAGQFTDVYTRIGSPALRRAVHRLNALWFHRVGRPGPAVANILVFERT
ncbi:MAG TPA: class I SAM-dependent methyltransferase [Thermoleophilaceae bacterium]|nr:class I SAM-dependent methyltransferase [Thermoleophilaceae bacterium]